MSDSIALELSSTLQSASIQRHPDVLRDLNPSTAASKKEPVYISPPTTTSSAQDNDIDYARVHVKPRRSTMPPLPDLRFEQSYLKSIDGQTRWQAIAWITLRDQVSWHVYLPTRTFA